MPQSKEVHREYMRHRREGSQKGRFTGEGSQTKDGTFFEDGVEMVMPLGTLPARPRYLTLSDEQVLDRANQPKPDWTLWAGWKIQAMRRCTGDFTPLKGREFGPELRKTYAIK